MEICFDLFIQIFIMHIVVFSGVKSNNKYTLGCHQNVL